MGHVRNVPSKRQAVVDDDTKLNLLLAQEENPITPARQLARDKWIVFSDEVTFTLNGHENRQHCRYWAEENPHWMRELHTQRPQKTNVWAGIIHDRIDIK
ncbi:hypothetical protein NQ318_011416 [Aromia moschata]|uniref:Transposase n=1 Tax=Aromia moschata TaxID=1265417 RepID=A0AAV8YVD6_9CUCU|nr:hypothetical protein NQ318_011416 [Aromia moschata]